MLTVSLDTIQIRGPHGLYPEEAINGNDFEIDVRLSLPTTIDEDWPLLDYSRVSEIVHAVMKGETVPLLEILVRDIYNRLRDEWPDLGLVRVCVRKMQPPMPGMVNYAEVCFES
jgi:dihydroneopterin aldolase